MIALRDEKQAFERHQLLLDEQNRKLIGELDRLVAASDTLQKTLDKRDRVTELKERQRNTTMQLVQQDSKSPMRMRGFMVSS